MEASRHFGFLSTQDTHAILTLAERPFELAVMTSAISA